MPGEQHTFGVVIAAEFFLRAGWEVHRDPAASSEELSSTVSTRRFAVAGTTPGNDDRLDMVAAFIRRVRRESLNRGIGVMVGGRVSAERPELARLVGADATAMNGRQGAWQAGTPLALLALRDRSLKPPERTPNTARSPPVRRRTTRPVHGFRVPMHHSANSTPRRPRR